MIHQLDPRLPLVWRTPTSLQIGIDSPEVVLTDVTPAQERMISALVLGITRPGLDLITTSTGSDPQVAPQLLAALRGVLRPPPVSPPPPADSIVISGTGPTAAQMVDLLASAGLTVSRLAADVAPDAPPADFAVIIASHVIDPAFHGHWLRRDVPHLGVVLGDSEVRIGPVVEPGDGPCLYCLELHHTDADPAWPAMAAQLWGRRSPLDTGLVAAEAATVAARLVLSRLDRGRAWPATSIVLDAGTGIMRRAGVRRHPECGCAALPENGTLAAGSGASGRPARTTGAGVGAPA